MLIILLRAHSTMSNEQQLLVTIFIGIVIGTMITARGQARYDSSSPKVFLFALIVEIILTAIISFFSLAWGIGIFYGAVFGTIFFIGIHYFSNKR